MAPLDGTQDCGMVSAGELLIATPGMHDGTFDRTVIFLLDHDEEGSMGLVLNRPSGIAVTDALPVMARVAEPAELYLGGPVEEGTALILAEPADPASPEMHYMREGVGLFDMAGPDEIDSSRLIRARVFSGYAGWGPRQLETELRAGAWITATMEPGDLWSESDDAMWARVLRRQGGLTRFLASYPDQPWLN